MTEDFKKHHNKFRKFLIDPSAKFTLLNRDSFFVGKDKTFEDLFNFSLPFMIAQFEDFSVYRESLLLQAVESKDIHVKYQGNAVHCLYHLKFWKNVDDKALFNDRSSRLISFDNPDYVQMVKDDCYLFEYQLESNKRKIVCLYDTTRKHFTGYLPSWVSRFQNT